MAEKEAKLPKMTENNSKLPRQFGKIILTLENCLLSDNKLQETPSQHDGLNKEIETDLRILGCELIQIAGILLKLPQVAMATGQVLFQRFYYSKSYLRHNMETTAMSCIYLASKIEEAPRRIRDVINVFHHIKQMRGQKPIHPMILDSSYIALKNQVIKAERRVLKELGFCVHVKHPHKLIVMYLQVLGYEQNQRLMQMAWNFMNDSLRTDVFVRYNPESIACACIYLTARKINLPLPNHPTWYGVFNVSEEDILDISYKIMDLYRRPKPNAEALDQSIEKLKKNYEEVRNKNKVGPNTPPTVTTVDRNDGSHNAWGGFISRVMPPNPVVTNDGEKKAAEQKSSATGQSEAQLQPPDSNNQVNQTSQPVPHKHESTHDILQSSKKPSRLSRDQQRRSHSRSSRSKSASQSPSDNNRSRNYKKSRYRSRSRSRTPDKRKKSPSRHLKRREKSDYGSNNGEPSDKKHRSSDKHREYKRDRSRERERFRGHDRYRGSGGGGGSAGAGGGHRMQQDNFRDRKR